MAVTRLNSTFTGSKKTLVVNPPSGENVGVSVTEPNGWHGIYVNGPALRDALLEAFPLEEPTPSGAADRLADWEKELLAGVKPKPVKPDYAPGTVVNTVPSSRYVILPKGWYNIDHGITGTFKFTNSKAAVVFDPRDGVALPSPLGIRVGDTVRRVINPEKGKATITTEFVVNHIDETGAIYPICGSGFRPDGFEVTSREVPDRLPAGTIVRLTGYPDLRLITDKGGIHLSGYVNPNPEFRDGSDYTAMVKRGEAEVIYLPES